jgi:hypothetical protein
MTKMSMEGGSSSKKLPFLGSQHHSDGFNQQNEYSSGFKSRNSSVEAQNNTDQSNLTQIN